MEIKYICSIFLVTTPWEGVIDIIGQHTKIDLDAQPSTLMYFLKISRSHFLSQMICRYSYSGDLSLKRVGEQGGDIVGAQGGGGLVPLEGQGGWERW
jgi:hypothetical protein